MYQRGAPDKLLKMSNGAKDHNNYDSRKAAKRSNVYKTGKTQDTHKHSKELRGSKTGNA